MAMALRRLGLSVSTTYARPVRTPREDIALLWEAGVWNGDRDPLMNAVILLCMYAKRRHKPAPRRSLGDAGVRGRGDSGGVGTGRHRGSRPRQLPIL